MIPNPYTFAVLAVTRQFPEVLMPSGILSSVSHTRGTAVLARSAILSLFSFYHLQRWMSWLE